jgi:hypothetical protein
MTELTIKIGGAQKAGKAQLAHALKGLLREHGLEVEVKDSRKDYRTSNDLLRGLKERGTKILIVGDE